MEDSNCEESVCVVDFCGGYRSARHGYINPFSFSADWFPAEKLVHFTGAWSDVPPMPADIEPTETAVTEYAGTHVDFEDLLDMYFKELNERTSV